MKSWDPFVRVPLDQRFYLKDREHLESEIRRLDLPLPVDPEGEALLQPWDAGIGSLRVPNRFYACADEGGDAGPDGEPTAATIRRYHRLALGGAGLVCTEPVALDPGLRRNSRQLCLQEGTLHAFAGMVEGVRERVSRAGQPSPRVLLHVEDPVGGPVGSSGDSGYARAARLAFQAGFDGLEIACDPHGLAEALAAGRAWESPDVVDELPLPLTRAVSSVRSACPEFLLSVRLCVYSADPQSPPGFGTDPLDYRRFDPALPVRLVRRLAALGVGLVHATFNFPRLRGDPGVQRFDPILPEDFPQEHPLGALARAQGMLGALRAVVPGVGLAAGGMLWLRHFLPLVASGWIRDGVADLIVLRRFALAYPDAPLDWVGRRELDPERCCLQCGACLWLRDSGASAGCVVQDRETYGPDYRHRRRFLPSRLLAEARRCHQCNPAPCVFSTPARLDIPGMLRTYARGDVQRAGHMLRKAQWLPEMCAQLSPFGASGEARCVETVLSGTPVAIRDVQYSAAVQTRSAGFAGPSLPGASGFRVAIAGAGPTGLSAAATLLQFGCHVTLYEEAGMPGGVPALLIPSSRHAGSREEIDRLLEPARRAGRLEERYGIRIGGKASVRDARAGADALLLAVGLWADRLLCGSAQGVFGGTSFLAQAKSGRFSGQVGAAAVLAGGDCAMDAASVLHALGAAPLYVLFEGTRSQMHWCMDEAWFAGQGVNLLTLCRPLDYRLDESGRVTGVHTQRMEPDGAGGGRLLPGSFGTLPVSLVVDASGVEAPGFFREAVDEEQGVFAAGALVNGGASVPHCVEEGIRVAEKIHRWLQPIARSFGAGGSTPCN